MSRYYQIDVDLEDRPNFIVDEENRQTIMSFHSDQGPSRRRPITDNEQDSSDSGAKKRHTSVDLYPVTRLQQPHRYREPSKKYSSTGARRRSSIVGTESDVDEPGTSLGNKQSGGRLLGGAKRPRLHPKSTDKLPLILETEEPPKTDSPGTDSTDISTDSKRARESKYTDQTQTSHGGLEPPVPTKSKSESLEDELLGVSGPPNVQSATSEDDAHSVVSGSAEYIAPSSLDFHEYSDIKPSIDYKPKSNVTLELFTPENQAKMREQEKEAEKELENERRRAHLESLRNVKEGKEWKPVTSQEQMEKHESELRAKLGETEETEEETKQTSSGEKDPSKDKEPDNDKSEDDQKKLPIEEEKSVKEEQADQDKIPLIQTEIEMEPQPDPEPISDSIKPAASLPSTATRHSTGMLSQLLGKDTKTDTVSVVDETKTDSPRKIGKLPKIAGSKSGGGMIAEALGKEPTDVSKAVQDIERILEGGATSGTPDSADGKKYPFVRKVTPPEGEGEPGVETKMGGGMIAQALGKQPTVQLQKGGATAASGGGMIAQALGKHPTTQESKSSGGMIAQALGKQPTKQVSKDSSTADIKGGMIAKALGKTSPPLGDALKSDKDAGGGGLIASALGKTAATYSRPDRDMALVPFEDFTSHLHAGESKLDASFHLLNLCSKGDWRVVENMLRYATKEKYDLTLMDDAGFTVFLLCIRENKVRLAKRLLNLGARASVTTKDGRTAAHIAAARGNDQALKFILSKRPELARMPGPGGQLPLHIACERVGEHSMDMIQVLLNATSTNLTDARLLKDKEGNLPLHVACAHSNVGLASALLTPATADRQINAPRTDNGDTALHIATKRADSIEMVRLLANWGADPNVKNKVGRTPLHYVAVSGNENLLRIMYTMKADANICDTDDYTPLHCAVEKGHVVIAERLVDKFAALVTARTRDGSTLMHIAARYGYEACAEFCLKRGVPLHMPNKSGALGLHCAAMMGHVGVVRTLLDRGTAIDIKTKEGFTALHVAVQSGKPDVIECLLGHGADVCVTGGPLQQTPLHIAAGLDGQSARVCADQLLKSGAEANIRQSVRADILAEIQKATGNGETCLHLAARVGNAEMCDLMLRDGADPTAASGAGESPLHVAVRNCHWQASKLLMQVVEQHGGKQAVKQYVNQRNKDGHTPLHLAAEIRSEQAHYKGEDAKVAELLIEGGGDVAVPAMSTGETVMHTAARNGNEQTLLSIVKTIGPGAVQIALNKQSKKGWSPLLEACDRGHKKVVDILLKHHARVDVFDEHGRTGLHLAAGAGHLAVCDTLLRHKAFVNSKNKTGETPLHLAAMGAGLLPGVSSGHARVVALLVQDHGASLEALSMDVQTPLHYAAKSGQLPVSNSLLAMGANANAKDSKGQTPLHLAAENDYPEVVKLFLKMKQQNKSVLTATDENGFTCAHIAAIKGSLAVVKELMMIDKPMVIEAKTKNTESTALHMAAAGGHKTIVKTLIENGADIDDENLNGMSALHMAARHGHITILEVFDKTLWKKCSRKTGLNALHVAAYYGQIEFLREMIAHVPAISRTEPAGQLNPLVVKEFASEYGFTALHMAAQAGHDGLVRILLNMQGVQVDATSTTMNVIALHLAAQSGHIAVVGMLLSRSTQQLHIKDAKGRTPLHLAAMNGHYDMVALLIAQGSSINAMDQNGWTGMHFATKAGHLRVVRLFVESGADPQAETREQKIPLAFAASYNHVNCLSYLMKQDHDTHALMEDRRFIFDLMVCGKSHANRPVEEFVLASPAPIDTAVNLSTTYKDMSEKEKERARDLLNVAAFCDQLAVELMSIAATEYNPALLLKAHDNRSKPFLDVLIEHEQKDVVSHASVQRYLTEIWNGGIQWGMGKFGLFFLLLLLCPPAWIVYSLPLDNKVCRAPIIKFVCHLVSHVYFTVILTLVVLNICQKIYQVNSFVPHTVEWLLIFWMSGSLVTELSVAGGHSGLGMIRIAEIFLGTVGAAFHVIAFAYPAFFMEGASELEKVRQRQDLLYLKNQFFAFVLLLTFVHYLDFLQVHHLFGPWAIIIRDLMYDLTRFLVILFLFVAGFTLHVTSIFQPAYKAPSDDEFAAMRMGNPGETAEMLFFSLFGLIEPDQMPPLHLVPYFSKFIMKLVFGIYLLVTLIVLINLLIAMMSDTYQRIQAQSDTEWKFGRAMLIRQMNKRSATPAPINMFTKFVTFVRVWWRNNMNMFSVKAQEDLRHEENIDAFSTEHTGSAEPGMKIMLGDDTAGDSDALLGADSDVSAWKIETIIPWKRVVDIYCRMQGYDDDDEDNGHLSHDHDHESPSKEAQSKSDGDKTEDGDKGKGR